MKKLTAGLLSLLALTAWALPVAAQDSTAEDAPSSEAPAEGEAADEEGKEGAEATPVDAAKSEVDAAGESAAGEAEPKPEPEPEPEPALPAADSENPFGDSPIADLADAEFVPLEDIEEGALEQIIPARVYPNVDFDGSFRTRTRAMMNWDLDTGGTSAVLPPAESFTPLGNPVNPDKDTRWDANMRLRLEPTLNITEQLRVVMELDLLNNLNFGSLPSSRIGSDPLTPSFSGIGQNDQLPGREREFFSGALGVNELYGEVDTLLGKLSVGRMDEHWGLGIRGNDGDCEDCDFGSSYERFQFQTKLWELYGFGSVDFPDEGLASRVIERDGGQPYDIAQIDDVDQYTVGVFRRALTREEQELRGKRLLDDDLPVFEGGLLYRYRKQDGRFSPQYNGSAFDPVDPRALIYRGERAHLVDLWAEFLYEPDFDRRVRVGFEGAAWLGRVDNVTDEAVGLPESAGEEPTNCFDEDAFSANEEACTTDADGNRTRQDVQQFALALESEFRFGGPVSFGLNAGVASGGKSANWGAAGADMSYFRFDPDYHVDLILFRNVIGTVTNAYYANPWAMVRFLESSSRHMELQIDAIGSSAVNAEGTPSGQNSLLGVEFDAALRYLNLDLFNAQLEGGILFPFEGLHAVQGRERYRAFGVDASDFNADARARIAWTVQAKLFWNF